MNLTIDPGLVVWTLITFAGLLLVLSRVAFKPLQKILSERERLIEESLRKAAEAAEEVERIRRRNEEAMGAARAEAARILEESRHLAAEARQESLREARREAEAILAEARNEMDREIRRGLDELKQTVANLSVRVAQEVIREEMNPERHEALVKDFVERLKRAS